MAPPVTAATGSTAQTARKSSVQPKALPPPNSDFYQLKDVLTADELALVKKVRTYMETKVAPIIDKYWADDAFPFELLPTFKQLGIGGLGFEGYGCAGGSQKLFGFVAMDLARVDASMCTFFGVHSGLAMGSIYLDGSEEQKQKWLPPMARWEKIGCFGLTEQDVDDDLSEGTPRRIRELLAKSKSPAAHCETAAVSGQCCMAEVQKFYMRGREAQSAERGVRNDEASGRGA